MIRKSKDGLFDISEIRIFGGMSKKENSIGLEFRAQSGKSITLVDVANAVSDFYSQYDYNNRKSAPVIHVVVYYRDNRTISFNVSWNPEDDYLRDIATQIELQ